MSTKHNKVSRKYLSRSGEKHWAWKGANVGYTALHDWVYKRKGKANRCESCGATEIPENRKYWFHWSCKDGKYSRNLETWWSLCIPCHRKFDGWGEKMSKANKGSTYWKKRTRDKITGKFL